MNKDKTTKLTYAQKRAARFIFLGYKLKLVANKSHTHIQTVRKWIKTNKRFKRYLNLLDQEFDSIINRKQKAALDKVYERLAQHVSNKRASISLHAIEIYLKVNRRFPETSNKGVMDVNVKGDIVNTHEGEIQLKNVTPEKKAAIKELLESTRELMNSSN